MEQDHKVLLATKVRKDKQVVQVIQALLVLQVVTEMMVVTEARVRKER